MTAAITPGTYRTRSGALVHCTSRADGTLRLEHEDLSYSGKGGEELVKLSLALDLVQILFAAHFPALLHAAEARFADRVNPERSYADALEEPARRVRSRYEFKERPFRRPADPAPPSQLRLSI